jgi:hypothetical protein
MELKDIVKKIEDIKVIAGMTPTANPKTYNAQLGKIRRAQEDLNLLLDDYRQAVRHKVVFILSAGAGADKFTQIASEGCFSLDAKELFNKITDKINPVLYGNQPFNASTLDTAMSYFSELADTIGITSYPQVIFKAKYAKKLDTKEDLSESLRESMSEAIGSDIVGHYSVHAAAQLAINERFTGKVVPVVLHSKDEAFIKQLSESLKNITPNVFLIDSKEDVSDKEVESALKKIKKAVV